MDREAWRAAIDGVTKSWTRLSNWTELNWTEYYLTNVHKGKKSYVKFKDSFKRVSLEKEMATHSSVLAWRIQGQRSLAGYSLWGRKSRTQPSDN